MSTAVVKTVKNGVDFEKNITQERFGIPRATSRIVREAFAAFFLNFCHCFATKTCNNSYLAKEYITGLITMQGYRNFANIARRINGVSATSDNLQHFMSNSPWFARAVYDKIQEQIASDPDFNGGILTIDETGDKRNSENCAGASIQYWGREAKKEMVQTGVCLGYYNRGIWTGISSELYIAEKWFTDNYAKLRKKTGIPDDVNFLTKPQLASREVEKAIANGIKCEVVVGDSNYGRDGRLRKSLGDMGLTYLLDTSPDARVFLREPKFKKPRDQWKCSKDGYYYPKTVDGQKSIRLDELVKLSSTEFQTVRVRDNERGFLENDFYTRRVWVMIKGGILMEEQLLIRRQKNGKISYSLGNAHPDTSLKQLALWRCYRYFIERIFQDTKSDLGLGEMEARKHLSWQHHTALTILALWFIASLKLDWKRSYPADPLMAEELEVNVLPALSTKNVKELFRCAFGMSHMTEQEVHELIFRHLNNRARSTASRLRKQKSNHVGKK